MRRALLINTSALLTATVFAAAPALAQSADWTGAYIGGEIGLGTFDVNVPGGSVDNDDLIGGLVAGYDFDLGTWVVGAGVDIDFADINLPGSTASLDRLYRLKLRGGYKIGSGLLYGTGGYTHATLGNARNDEGYFFGAGYEYLTQSNFSVGGEVLYHQFDNFNGTNANFNVVTYQIRGTFRF
jgi:opacity protein-like surface antigen